MTFGGCAAGGATFPAFAVVALAGGGAGGAFPAPCVTVTTLGAGF